MIDILNDQTVRLVLADGIRNAIVGLWGLSVLYVIVRFIRHMAKP